MSKPLDGYVEVNVRIQRFYERYPQGSLALKHEPRIFEVAGKSYVAVTGLAFRGPDDTHPGEGTAWELVPGPTSFTKDSELQNAETSAWGRAIAALGFEVKEGIATREDVQRARAKDDAPKPNPQRLRNADLWGHITGRNLKGRAVAELLKHVGVLGAENFTTSEQCRGAVLALTTEQEKRVRAELEAVAA